MDNLQLPWFTVETIDDKTFAISEYGHWEQVHSYLVLGDRSAALIDSGLGVDNIRAVVDRLTDLPVQVLTTHVHWDHIGGHGLFDRLYVHAADADWLAQGIPQPLPVIRAQFTPENFSRPAPSNFSAADYTPFTGQASRLQDGEVIDLGGRQLLALHTPGHSPGHLCFHESASGYLYTGDLLYAGTLYAFYPSTDPAAFAASTQRLTQFPVRRILPGHNKLQVGPDLLETANAAWQALAAQNLLHHGGGTHDFGLIRIKL